MSDEGKKIRELEKALDDARKFIEVEYRDYAAEPEGEWLAKEARHIHRKICDVLYPDMEIDQ